MAEGALRERQDFFGSDREHEGRTAIFVVEGAMAGLEESVKYRGEPLSGTMRWATLRA